MLRAAWRGCSGPADSLLTVTKICLRTSPAVKRTEPRRAKNAVTFLFVHQIDPGFFLNCSTHVTLQACVEKSGLSCLVFVQLSAKVLRAVKKPAIWVLLLFAYWVPGANTGRKRWAHHLRVRNGGFTSKWYVILVVDANQEMISDRMKKSASFYA